MNRMVLSQVDGFLVNHDEQAPPESTGALKAPCTRQAQFKRSGDGQQAEAHQGGGQSLHGQQVAAAVEGGQELRRQAGRGELGGDQRGDGGDDEDGTFCRRAADEVAAAHREPEEVRAGVEEVDLDGGGERAGDLSLSEIDSAWTRNILAASHSR